MEVIMKSGRQLSVITVVAEPQGKYYFVNSPDLPGLALKGKDYQELFEIMPYLIKELYKDNYGMDVEVTRISEPEESTGKWAIAA